MIKGWNRLIDLNNRVYFVQEKEGKLKEFQLGDEDKIIDHQDYYCGSTLSIPGYFYRDYSDARFSHEQLPSGIYSLEYRGGENRLYEINNLRQDKILELSLSEEIKKQILKFKESHNIYQQLKLTFKSGILLFGPPGTGKSTLIRDIITSLDLKNLCIIFLRTELCHSCIESFKTISQFKILIFEELTESIRRTGAQELLEFFDGESSLDNCLTIATTNYPQKLPSNFVDRPGRFDMIFEIGYLKNHNDINKYFKYLMQREANNCELEQLSNVNYLSVAYLKEICLRMLRNNWDLTETLKSIGHQRERALSNFKPLLSDKDLDEGIL